MKTDQPQINLFGCSSILLLQVFPNKTRSLSPTFLQKCTKKKCLQIWLKKPLVPIVSTIAYQFLLGLPKLVSEP